MKRKKRTPGPSVGNDIDRMMDVLIAAKVAHTRRQYVRSSNKLADLSIMASEYAKKGKS